MNESAQKPVNLNPVCFRRFEGFIGISGCKVNTFKPIYQNNLVKKS